MRDVSKLRSTFPYGQASECRRGLMRGMGYSIAPMIVSLSGACAFRLLWVYTVFAADPRMTVLYNSYPISWTLTFLAHLACYFFMARPKMMRMEREGQREEPA